MSEQDRDTARQFSRQAEAYAASPSHARGEDLDRVLGLAAPGPVDLCLDLATGPGHTAFRVAAQAGRVIGFDIATGMIEVARRRAAEACVTNLQFVVGDVHALPFPSAILDLVTCRIAPHHFRDVPGALREAARVLKPDGRLVIEDSLAPDDPAVAAFLEDLEKRRDATHVHSLSRGEWIEACAAGGLRVVQDMVYRKRHDRRTGLDDAQIAAIAGHILAAPGAVRDTLFEIEDDRIAVLKDRKLIFRAEPASR
jgi:SAM-dependent methyltransferase